MPPAAAWLIAASAALVAALGLAHGWFTFRGRHFHPRDAALQQRMQEVAPVLTRQTTMWRAWVGFNASHSLGALLFGAVYANLALAHGPVLFGSPFLLGLGAATLAAYALLARRYWFRLPLRGLLLAGLLYALGWALA